MKKVVARYISFEIVYVYTDMEPNSDIENVLLPNNIYFTIPNADQRSANS